MGNCVLCGNQMKETKAYKLGKETCNNCGCKGVNHEER